MRGVLLLPEGNGEFMRGLVVQQRSLRRVEPLACVIRGLEETGLRSGDSVAIIGLGPIGMMFVLLAKAIYKARVIAIGRRPTQLDRASAMGADETVLNNDHADPVGAVRKLTAGRGADVVIEAVGLPEVWQLALR